jgi:alkylation response protein AidB-like acyl-CoA dehydrogenase
VKTRPHGAATGSDGHVAAGSITRPVDPEAVDAALWLREAVGYGDLDLPQPGAGRTAARFAALAELGAHDPVHARLGEGHADAVAILTEVGASIRPGAWGVWAAAPASLRARRTAGAWTLTGERPWCSGAWACSHALVTAQTDDGIRMFAVDTAEPGLSALPGTWPAVGMAASDTRTIAFRDSAATAVGGPGDYLNRPGFWHGAIGVAACWYGGAVGLARLLLQRAAADAAAGRRDPHLMAHLGAVDAALAAAAHTLLAAAELIDAEPATSQPRLGARVRASVEAVASEVMARVGRACGAEPLGHDRAHARRVADLTVYLRQSHAERDLADLGQQVADTEDPATVWTLIRPAVGPPSGRA